MAEQRIDEATRKRDLLSGLPLTNEASLVVIYGTGLGRRYGLATNATIGRDRDNSIVLDVPDVSRHHAELRLIRDRWFINDLLSTNGTEVNGKLIEGETLLNNGDFVNVGGVIFKYIGGGNVESLFHEEIYRMTVFDGLTGLHNKRYLVEFLDRETARAGRHHRPLSLAMIDVDHFKKVNDSHGHLAGDHMLAAIATLFANNVKSDELVARYGGEEFALVLPEADVEHARKTCDRLRSVVESEVFSLAGAAHKATVSIGVAQFREGMTRDEFITAADEQLYKAKKAGRNRVC